MDKLRSEVRTLHEAYQFLSCKYIKHFELEGQEELFDDDMQSGYTSKGPDDIANAMDAYVFGYSKYVLQLDYTCHFAAFFICCRQTA